MNKNDIAMYTLLAVLMVMGAATLYLTFSAKKYKCWFYPLSIVMLVAYCVTAVSLMVLIYASGGY